MIVCKFGGTSVATSDSAKNIKKILADNPNRRIVVVSALGTCKEFNYKITDKLFELFHTIECDCNYKKIVDEIFIRYEKLSIQLEMDIDWKQEKDVLIKNIISKNYTKEYLASRGEYYSAILYSKYLGYDFVDAKDYIKINKNGKIDVKNTKKCLKKLIFSNGVVVGGYYGSDELGNICVLDRGGSDITGAIIARELNCEIYENFTDVDGIYDKNPNMFKAANHLPVLSYKSAINMADNGNEVVHKDALCYMNNSNSVMMIKSTNNYKALGTIIAHGDVLSNNLFVSRSKLLCVVFNVLDNETYLKLNKICEVFKIINYDKKYIVLIKSIYYPIGKLEEMFDALSVSSVVTYSLFSQIMFNKDNLKIIKKISKNVKKNSIYCEFVSFFNNFLIIGSLKDDNKILATINKCI